MIKTDKVTKIYNKGKKNEFAALIDVSIEINEGDFVAITGTSGAGKSTLLYVMSGVDTYESGSVMIYGTEIKDMSDERLASLRNEKIGFVMQDFALIEDFSVYDNVFLPLRFTKVKNRNKKEMAMNAIDKVGITGLKDKLVGQLSGGQKQRCAIARALVNSPDYIFADEPTGALDSKTSSEIMDLLEKLNKDGKTVVVVTHDPVVAGRAKRVLKIEDGRIME